VNRRKLEGNQREERGGKGGKGGSKVGCSPSALSCPSTVILAQVQSTGTFEMLLGRQGKHRSLMPDIGIHMERTL
jgi:hypothetical protein